VGTLLDVAAVVRHAGDVFVTAGATPKHGRVLTLCDDSGVEIRLLLWGEDADGFPADRAPCVIELRSARAGNYHGPQLSLSWATGMGLAPTTRRGLQLQQWWESGGKDLIFESLPDAVMPALPSDDSDWPSSLRFAEFYGVATCLSRKPRRLPCGRCPTPGCGNFRLQPRADVEAVKCGKCGKTVKVGERFAFSFLAADFRSYQVFAVVGDESIEKALFGSPLEPGRSPKFPTGSEFRIRTRQMDELAWAHDFLAINVAPINYGEAARFFAGQITAFAV
jgi:hypothetical protein